MVDEKKYFYGNSDSTSTIRKTLIDIEDYMGELRDIKNETTTFFKDLESEECEAK